MACAVVALVAGILIGRATESSSEDKPLATERLADDDVVQRIDALDAAWSAHDPAPLASFFTENAVFTYPDGEEVVGADAIAALASPGNVANVERVSDVVVAGRHYAYAVTDDVNGESILVLHFTGDLVDHQWLIT